MIAALGTFGDALSFIVERRELLLERREHPPLRRGDGRGDRARAVPLGVWLGHLHRGSFIAINAANIGRALPSLAVIAIGLSVFGFGFTNVLVALVILAVPPILTNAYVAVDEVEPEAVEAARGMGMTGWQTLRRVELLLALPLLFAGIRTAAAFGRRERHDRGDRRWRRARRDPLQPGELPDGRSGGGGDRRLAARLRRGLRARPGCSAR